MKGVLLNAGAGKRLYPITKCVSKGLVPVYDRPALMYQIDLFAAMNIRDVAVVISPEHEESYRAFLDGIDTRGVDIALRVQRQGAGVLAAYAACIDFVRGSDAVILMGDCLCFPQDVSRLRAQAEDCFARDGFGIVCGAAKPGALAAFFERDGDGGLRHVYRQAAAGETCAIGMHFIPRSLTTAPMEDFVQPGFTETDADAVSARAILSGRLALPQLAPGDRWFDIGTPEGLFRAAAFVRERSGVGSTGSLRV